jgi:hypothetical protein
MTCNWWKENADKKYLNQFDVVLVLWTEETVGQGLDAEPLCQNERTQPPELEKILKNFTPFSSLNKKNQAIFCYQKKHLIIIVIALISMYWTGFLIKKFRFGKKNSLVCKAVLLKKSKLTLSLGFLPSALLVIWRQSSSMTAPFDLLDLKYWRDLRMLYFLAFKLKIDFGIYYFHSYLLLYKLQVIFRACFLKKSTNKLWRPAWKSK